MKRVAIQVQDRRISAVWPWPSRLRQATRAQEREEPVRAEVRSGSGAKRPIIYVLGCVVCEMRGPVGSDWQRPCSFLDPLSKIPTSRVHRPFNEACDLRLHLFQFRLVEIHHVAGIEVPHFHMAAIGGW